MSTPNPFLYPAAQLHRKHGPGGYASHASYGPWLRDEFLFRCGYCLCRERWVRRLAAFDADHFQPQVLRPDLAQDYANLVNACHRCNVAKGVALVPIVPSAVNLRVDHDGTIHPLDDDGQRVVDLLSLDDVENTEWRKGIIGIIRNLSRARDRETFLLWMGFPTDLPDLSKLNPPHNSRPEGVAQSCRARRDRGELPSYYE